MMYLFLLFLLLLVFAAAILYDNRSKVSKAFKFLLIDVIYSNITTAHAIDVDT